MVKITFRYAAVLAIALGVVCALLYHLSAPRPIADKTPASIRAARDDIAAASRDVAEHDETIIKEVRIIRETIAENVAALDPD